MRVTEGERPHESGKAAKRASRKGKGRGENVQEIPAASSKTAPLAATDDNAHPWSWSFLADSQVSRQAAVFTRDGRYFFVSVSSAVKIYSTMTGKVVSTLKSHSRVASGSSDRITCLKINPKNSFQLLTGSVDGTLRTWDFVNGLLLSTIDVGYPITYLCAHQDIEDYVFVACKKASKKQGKAEGSQNFVILRVSLRTSAATANARIQKSTELLTVGKVPVAIGLGISASGKWLVVAGGTKVYVAATSNLKSGFTKFVCPEKLTCMAIHPTEDWLATGDENGQLRLWYCLKDELSFENTSENRTAPTTTLHWHAHAVQAIEFTPNGAYLLSGGEESVLVIWQLHTGKKEFVPRVGAPIQTISICDTGDGAREQEYLLGLSDGSMAFVRSSSLKLSRTIARVKLESAHLRPGAAPPLAMHPQSGHLFLPSSHPSSLQIYSPTSSSLVTEVEVSPSNRVSRPHEKPLEPCRVDQIAISACGRWLATVDLRDGSDEGFGLEVYLKLWGWYESENRWDLNTKVDRPHGNHKVHSISFSPSAQNEMGTLLVSTGGDGNTKTWATKVHTEKNEESEIRWIMRSSFSYRDQIPTQAIWSPDGSILAVCQGGFVTLWAVRTNALYKVLSWAEVHRTIWIAFIDRDGRYLCVSGLHSLAVYDLIRAQTVYIFKTPLPIRSLLSWRRSEGFAIVQDTALTAPGIKVSASTTTFSIFGLHSNQPTQKRTVPFSLRQYTSWQGKSNEPNSVVAITNDGGLVRIGDDIVQVEEEGNKPQPLGSAPLGPSLFQDIFGQSALVDHTFLEQSSRAKISSTLANTGPHAGRSADWEILDTPAHLLPPVHSLFMSLMESISHGSSRADPISIQEQEDEQNPVEATAIDAPEQKTRNSAGRGITNAEIDAFVDFFRETVFTAPERVTSPSASLIGASPPRASHLTNGKGKLNGLPMINGTTSVLTSPVKSTTNGIHFPKGSKIVLQSQRAPSPTPRTPTPTIGKKRKKAMMS